MSTLAEDLERELGLVLDATDRAQLERLGSDADVRTAASSILVHETWFFREPRVFDELESIARASSAPLRVLSAPCATGEEAWSIAMALTEAGLAPGAFEVVGVDFADAAIARAERGRYGRASFRGAPRAALEKWVARDGDDATVRNALTTSVRFRVANLVAPFALADEAPFDVIFCRNFLVYLTDEARVAVERLVDRLLTRKGALFLGAGETLTSGAFVREGPAETFRFRRADASSGRAAPQPLARSRRGSPSSAPGRLRMKRKSSGPPAAPRPSPAVARVATLEEVRVLADRGELDAACELCEQLLVREGHAAETYALFGTIQSARGRTDEARAAWRRALYLDPANEVARSALGQAPLQGHHDAVRAPEPRRPERRGS